MAVLRHGVEALIPMPHRPTNLLEWHDLSRQAGQDERRLARQLGVTQRTLQLWWRPLGIGSLEVWLQERRLALSVPLLQLFGSVKEAAVLAGYSDSTVFGRQFRHFHEITPGEYIARFQATSPWWTDPQKRPGLLAMQNECRAKMWKQLSTEGLPSFGVRSKQDARPSVCKSSPLDSSQTA